MVGIRGTKIILTAMNILMLLIIIAAWITNLMTYHPEIILATAVNLIYIWLVNKDTPRWVYSIWIEGLLFVPIVGNVALNIFY